MQLDRSVPGWLRNTAAGQVQHRLRKAASEPLDRGARRWRQTPAAGTPTAWPARNWLQLSAIGPLSAVMAANHRSRLVAVMAAS
jgi:hypothetical protein